MSKATAELLARKCAVGINTVLLSSSTLPEFEGAILNSLPLVELLDLYDFTKDLERGHRVDCICRPCALLAAIENKLKDLTA